VADIRIKEYLDLEYVQTAAKPVLKQDLLAINRLLKELTKKPRKITSEILGQIVSQSNLRLMMARDYDKDRYKEQSIVAMGIVHWEKTLTKTTAHIEDIVVGKECRGMGIGEKLVKELIYQAKTMGQADCVDLTSKPEREAANALYIKLGFVKRNDKTNIYRLTLKK
jgi:ribosomal protein S18 acetylase RimI-like enzyme